MVDTTVELQQDCRATRIPAGEEVLLPQGTPVLITQALGGSLTLRTDEGLFRVDPGDLDALGDEIALAVRTAGREEAERRQSEGFSEEAVWEALRGCYDPEIPVNIVDLGLVYDLSAEDREGGRHVAVKMTLTAPGCGMGPVIADDARRRVEAVPEVASAQVDIVWDPQWTPHMISPAGRSKLGLE